MHLSVSLDSVPVGLLDGKAVGTGLTRLDTRHIRGILYRMRSAGQELYAVRAQSEPGRCEQMEYEVQTTVVSTDHSDGVIRSNTACFEQQKRVGKLLSDKHKSGGYRNFLQMQRAAARRFREGAATQTGIAHAALLRRMVL